jgi:hypothetical protein
MCGQGTIDFLQNRGGEAIGSQQHDRVQVMRLRLQSQPLVARKRQFGHLSSQFEKSSRTSATGAPPESAGQST